jgi:hypothetical protein
MFRNDNPLKVQIYGDTICYTSLQCDSGLLCLDWRDICDGIQQCMSGFDEVDCDRLEMNSCQSDDEYRCMNGMCIPDQYFLDGTFDCLDWSDEIPFKDSLSCATEAVGSVCDDHICPPYQWSCGDGQCIRDRFAFQKPSGYLRCHSQRDQYLMCETEFSIIVWAMPNGWCYGERQYDGPQLMMNPTEEDYCEYLLKCALSHGGATGCPCWLDSSCADEFERSCSLPSIQYPRGGLMAPYVFFFYNRERDWRQRSPDWILINGTIRCHDALISVNQRITFGEDLNIGGTSLFTF